MQHSSFAPGLGGPLATQAAKCWHMLAFYIQPSPPFIRATAFWQGASADTLDKSCHKPGQEAQLPNPMLISLGNPWMPKCTAQLHSLNLVNRMCLSKSDFDVQSVGYKSAQSPTNWESIHGKVPSILCWLSPSLSIALDDSCITQNAKSKIVNCGYKKLVQIFLLQNVIEKNKEFAANTITMSSGLRPMQNGLKFEMFQNDFDVCVNFRCVGWCHHKMAINLYIYIYKEQAHTHTYWHTVTMQNFMWGSHLLSRFFWLVKCPKSSTKHIWNANKIILTLRAWQRSNSIVYQHRDRSLKSNQVKLLEYEMPGFCQNDTFSPCLDVAAACIRVSGHIWSIWRCSNTSFFKRYFLRPKGTTRTAWNAGFWIFGICIPLCIKRGGRIL